MTLSLANKSDKDEAIDLLQRLFQTFMFRGMTQQHKELVLNHLSWMRNQGKTLNVSCKLETVPELELTNIEIKAYYGAREQ